MDIAIAKRDVQICKNDKTFTNFIKGRDYRCLFRKNDIALIDEDRHSFLCDIDTFDKNFKLLEC